MSQQLALDLDDDFQRLAGFLLSERAGNALSPSALDGLMAAVAVCPDVIPPSEWLAAAWNGEEPTFDSDEEAKAVLGAIMSRYAEVLVELAGKPSRYRALVWQCNDGDARVDDWCHGFIVGAHLRPLTWAPLIASDDGIVLLPIMAHTRAFDDIAPDEIEKVRARLGTQRLLPALVPALYNYWRAPPSTPRTPKIGRNDPCPCGSGAKYKRCCLNAEEEVRPLPGLPSAAAA
jgi:uncharacterized protein